MSIDEQDNARPDPSPPDWSSVPTPVSAKPDRATYEASRRTELDRIRLIDIKRRQFLGYFYPWESTRLTTFGIATIVRSKIGRSRIRRRMNCIGATESWSTRWKGTCCAA
jgi:hypothetical protein